MQQQQLVADLNTFIQNAESPTKDQVYSVLGPIRRAVLLSSAPLLRDKSFQLTQEIQVLKSNIDKKRRAIQFYKDSISKWQQQIEKAIKQNTKVLDRTFRNPQCTKEFKLQQGLDDFRQFAPLDALPSEYIGNEALTNSLFSLSSTPASLMDLTEK